MQPLRSNQSRVPSSAIGSASFQNPVIVSNMMAFNTGSNLNSPKPMNTNSINNVASFTKTSPSCHSPNSPTLSQFNQIDEIFKCFICLGKAIEPHLCPFCSKIVCFVCIKVINLNKKCLTILRNGWKIKGRTFVLIVGIVLRLNRWWIADLWTRLPM